MQLQNSSPQLPTSRKKKITKALLLVAGTFSLVLAAIGIVLPVLPTTPFLLLSAACFLRSSERMYTWLLNNRWFGAYIKNYREGKGIPLKTKIFASTLLWATILYSALVVLNETLYVQVILIAIATIVSIHIFRLPTLKGQTAS